MTEEKVCPLMAQGYISGYISGRIINPTSFRLEESLTKEQNREALPKCLKENCALWVIHGGDFPGCCGLRKEN